MSGLVERVARSLAECTYGQDQPQVIDEMWTSFASEAEVAIREVLLALREPTPAMIDVTQQCEPPGPAPISPRCADALWRAMLQIAAEEHDIALDSVPAPPDITTDSTP